MKKRKVIKDDERLYAIEFVIVLDPGRVTPK
jgi:hypothetical protein